MKTEVYTADDYDRLAPWWRGRWGDAPDRHALPMSGLISEDEKGIQRAAGWVYLDMTSPFALIGWLVTNPDNTPAESKDHLANVIEGLKVMAHSQGRSNITTVQPDGSLSRLFERCGFSVRESDVKTLACQI